MIVSGFSGSPVTDTANGKSGLLQSRRAPGVHTANAQRTGNAPEPERANTRQDGASAAGTNAPKHQESGPVRFGAAGLPVFVAQNTDTANAADAMQNGVGSGSESAENTVESTEQRADRMKYLVDAMRSATQPKESSDGLRQALAAYRENFE